MTMLTKDEVIVQLRSMNQRQKDTLKAVKNLVKTGPALNVETLGEVQQVVDDWLGKLMNVLEDKDLNQRPAPTANKEKR